MDRETVDQLKNDFSWVEKDERVLAVLLFGSFVKDEEHLKSDIDLTLVVPGASYFYFDCKGLSDESVDIKDVLLKVFREVNTVSKNYDVHIFEELPLNIQYDIIEEHEVVYTADRLGMHEYFYNYRKLWADQRHRNTMSKEELLAGV